MAEEIIGNKAVEDAAIAWVVELERAVGREPRDLRYDRASSVDIASPPRTIEVKAAGRTARGEFLWIEVRQYEEACRNPEFYVYVVENVRQGDSALFRLKVFGGDRLQRLLARAKEKPHYEVPLPVAEYDGALVPSICREAA